MDAVKPGVSMRKFMLVVSVAMLMDTSFAGHLMAFQDSYVTPFGAYRTVVRGGPPPCGAYYPTVSMGQEIVVAFRGSCNCRAVGGNRRSGARLLNQIDS